MPGELFSAVRGRHFGLKKSLRNALRTSRWKNHTQNLKFNLVRQFRVNKAKIMSGSWRKKCGGKFLSQSKEGTWSEHSVIQRSALCQTLRVFCCRWNILPLRLVFFSQERLHSMRKTQSKDRSLLAAGNKTLYKKNYLIKINDSHRI